MSDRPTVVIVGAGYAGATLATLLDPHADVTVVERRDAFAHTVGSLRALVDPEFARESFLPYDQLLHSGSVVLGEVAQAGPGYVELADGRRLTADFVVLATGSSYPFPAKPEATAASDALAQLAKARDDLAVAEHVVLIGAGPVGVELAGEITDVWPEKRVTLLDLAPDLLTGPYDDRLRETLRAQLRGRGVDLILGRALAGLPGTPPNRRAPVELRFVDGDVLTVDYWVKCFGVAPQSQLLAPELAAVREPAGDIAVDEHLRIRGQERMFALGDVAAIGEPKRAGSAARHAPVVAENVLAVASGGAPTASYRPGPPVAFVPLGRHGGASQVPSAEGPVILGPEQTAERKGSDLRIDDYRKLLGLIDNE